MRRVSSVITFSRPGGLDGDCVREGSRTDCAHGNFPPLARPRGHIDLATRVVATGARVPHMSTRTKHFAHKSSPLKPADAGRDIPHGIGRERAGARHGWWFTVPVAFAHIVGRRAAGVPSIHATEAARSLRPTPSS